MNKIKEKLEERYVVNPITGCWDWYGSLDPAGYGQFNGKRAHRLSYECYKEPIPEGLLIRHLCNNPKCINPTHLATGTPADNGADKVKAYVKKPHKSWLKRVKERIPFWQKRILKNCDISDCWLWKPNSNNHTPAVQLGGRSVQVRKIAYLSFKGDLPFNGLFINSTCNNSKCVNPDHMTHIPYDRLIASRTISPEVHGYITMVMDEYGITRERAIETIFNYMYSVGIDKLSSYVD